MIRRVLLCMLFPVVKCECGNKKVADPRGRLLEQILQQNGVPVVEDEDIGEFYRGMKLYGIDKIYFFMFDFISKHRQA